MKLLKRFLKRLRIKDQIFISMILISVCSSIVLGTIVYTVSRYIIQRNYKEVYTYNLEVSSNITDIQMNSIVELVRSQLLNETLIRILQNAALTEGTTFSSSQNLELNKLLGEMAGQDQLIEGVSVISNNGKSHFYYKRIKSGYFSHYFDESQILSEDWIAHLQETSGKEQFFVHDVLIPEMSGYVSIGKKLINPYTSEQMGYMVVSIRETLFAKSFGKNSGIYQTASNMIIDSSKDSTVVYYNGHLGEEEAVLNAFLDASANHSKYLFTSYTNPTTGWQMVNVIENHDLNKDSAYIGGIILIAVVMLVLLSSRVSRTIANRINRPLGKLETVIEAVGEGDRHVREEFDDSEIGLIGAKFKDMVNNNLELRERLLTSELNEKEAELLLLQAQINPHFLYNTLDSLYCMALIDNNDNIARAVASLSNTFKLSLNKGDKYIKVKDELMHIREYMTIQNMRYNNRFDLQIDVDSRITDVYIIKFILQPFVENAMYHGLEAKIGPGYIKITGRQTENRILFMIEDDGIGIADFSVLENGYGVRNVRERIKLFYGEDYGVRFESRPGEGTKVFIEIPVEIKRGGLV